MHLPQYQYIDSVCWSSTAVVN